ncbi:MAG: nitroreductase [Blastococcus sp.]|jgi:nitroreductase|nr:nitroreductase [Blastococcus sp.]
MATDIDVTSADRLLTTTRAVRRRLDLERPVERQVLLDCISVAQQAPTGGNSQRWGFVVVTDAEKRARLADIYRAASGDFFAQSKERALAKGDQQTARVYDGAAYLADVLHRVPVHVIPCIRTRFPASGMSSTDAAGVYGSIAPAAWSFQLALRARGLGSAWTTMHLYREREVAQLLGIPEDVTQVALFPVAYYTGNGFSPADRPPPETVTHWEGWTAR